MDIRELIAEGIADFEAGRYRRFDSAQELSSFLRSLAQEVIDEASNSKRGTYTSGIPNETE